MRRTYNADIRYNATSKTSFIPRGNETRQNGNHGHRRRTFGEENGDKTAVTDVQYYVTVLPKDASQTDKSNRIAELADTITNIKESDVFVISMWIG
jgi:hypothetical protein